jgi:NADH-quinone oxidoreductase subunit M
MSLVLLIAIPLAGGAIAWLANRWSTLACRWIALASGLAGLGLAISLWARYFAGTGDFSPEGLGGGAEFVQQVDVSWIPQVGIRFHLGVDGLGLIMLMLTFTLVTLGVLASWKGIRERVGFFHFQLMWTAAGLAGVFMALDLFLFYFFFEMMLVPLYFLIAIWGHENRLRAAVKFFIYTQASGLLMLIAILGLYFVHGRNTGVYTFDYLQLLGGALSSQESLWLMLGFFAAFAVKLPVIPLHGWLPDAHSQAPTAGSVDLAGLVIKVGAFGMMRFMFPLFPESSFDLSGIGMALGVAGILYGAVMAFSQTDLKRLVAYTSVSHMGFVLLGIFAWNGLALQGVVLQIVCHGLSTGGLFILVGALDERLGTRDLAKMGGFWSIWPRMGGAGIFLAMAALGLPALGNFLADFLILLGAYQVNRPAAIIASVGLVFSTVYALWFVQKVFHGPDPPPERPSHRPLWGDLDRREIAMMAVVMVVILWLGVYPQTFVRTMKQTSDSLLQLAVPRATLSISEEAGRDSSVGPTGSVVSVGLATTSEPTLADEPQSADRTTTAGVATGEGGP